MPGEQIARPAAGASGAGAAGSRFGAKVAIVCAVCVVVLLVIAMLWLMPQLPLIAFSSILLAVLLNDMSSALSRSLPISHQTALLSVLLGILAAAVLVGWLLAPAVIEQATLLVEELPRAVERVRYWIEQQPQLRRMAASLPPAQALLNDTGAMLSRARSVFSGLLGGIANTAIVIFVGIYLAAKPSAYTGALLRLLPISRRERGGQVLGELGRTLSLWLRGKLFSMAVVGAATAAGLSLIGVPLALALGAITGLLGFIPYLGPIMAAIPAILMAYASDPLQVLYVIALFSAIQLLEGYLLVPLVERRTVSLPPALTIIMQVAFGLAFGLVGVALATPLAAVLAVAIAMLYVQDVLHDDVVLPSDRE